MNSTVLVDHLRFDDFLENQEIDAFVITPEFNHSNFRTSNVIEVRHKLTPTSPQEYHLAVIVKNLGQHNVPNVLKLKIQKLGNLN